MKIPPVRSWIREVLFLAFGLFVIYVYYWPNY
ncbi:hypothetical protein FHX57_006730 [Paraburkholderia tropica]|nr:hypothetical protein [Paraburkholderia tropica]